MTVNERYRYVLSIFDQIVELLKENKALTVTELARVLGMARGTVTKYILLLCLIDVVECKGSRRFKMLILKEDNKEVVMKKIKEALDKCFCVFS